MKNLYPTANTAFISFYKMIVTTIIFLWISSSIYAATITSAGTGDWNVGSTWNGGSIPTSGDDVVIQSNHYIFTSIGITRNTSTTVNGWFEIKSGGFAGGSVNMTYSPTQGGLIFSHTGSTYGVESGNTFWPVVNGPFNLILNPGALVTLQSSLSGTRTIAGTATLSSGLISDYASAFGISGTLNLKTNGYIGNNSPVYSIGSTLIYNTGIYNQGLEWTSFTTTNAGIGTPANVIINDTTTLNFLGSADQFAFGNVTISSNSRLNSNGRILNLSGNLTLSGTLNLSSDIYVGGNFRCIAGYTLNNNIKAFFFTGVTNPQIISSTGAAPILHYMLLTGSSAVQLACNLTVTGENNGDAINFNNAANTIDLNGNTFNVGAAGKDITILGLGSFKGSATSSMSLTSTRNTAIPLRFTTGFQILQQLTLDLSATDANLSTPLTLSTLALTNGSLDIGANDLTIAAAGNVTGVTTAKHIKTSATGVVKKLFTTAGNFTFPIGRNGYTPASITIISGTFGANAFVSMNVVNAPHPNNNASGATIRLNRYWKTSSSGLTAYDATLIFNYIDGEFTGAGLEANMKGAGNNNINWALSEAVDAAANTFTIPIISDIRLAYSAADLFDPLVSTKFYRTINSGDWIGAGTWASSSTLGGTYLPTTIPPDMNSNTITILNTHTVNISSVINFDQLTVNGTLVLGVAGTMTINNGAGADMTINGMLQILKNEVYGPTSVVASTSSTVVNAGGKIMIGNGTTLISATGYEAFMSNPANSWANGSTYEFNNNVASISTGGATYFPGNSLGATAAIFKISLGLTGIDISGTMILNGLLDVNSPLTFSGGTAKTFKSGFSGSSTIKLPVALGTIKITGPAAILDGSLNLTLGKIINVDNDVTVQPNSNIKITDGSAGYFAIKTNKQFLISSSAIFDIGTTADFKGSGTPSFVDIYGTFKTGNAGGLTTGGSIPSGGTITTLFSGSTIDYNGVNQTVSTNPTYYNLTLSNSGTKTNVSAITLNDAGTLQIINSATLLSDGNISTPTSSMGNLVMDNNARYIITNGSTQPVIGGTYSLLGNSVIEFNGNVTQTIRTSGTNKYYNHIEVTGNSVGNSSGNILVKTNGTFKVMGTGVFTINNNSIQAAPAATNVAVSVLSGGIFKVGDPTGFNGTTLTAIDASITNINLDANSTIDYIRGGDQTITNANSLIYGNLTLSGSGIKTAPSDTLSIKGNFTNSISPATSFKHNNGTVIFLGTTTQTYSAGTDSTNFYKVEIKNATEPVTFSSKASIEKELKLSLAAAKMTLNGDVTLKSTLTRTAAVAQILASSDPFTYGTGSGFVVERYLPGFRAWRLLSAPLQNGTAQFIFDSWQEAGSATPTFGVQISSPLYTSGGANGFDYFSAFPALKVWDPTLNNYTPITNTKTTNIGNAQGYYLFVRGDRTVGATLANGTPTILRAKGKINVLAQTFPDVPAMKYATIGNPYPSRIAFGLISKSGIANGFTVWNPALYGANGVGGFVAYTYDLGSNSYKNTAGVERNFIESGEAVFIQNNTAAIGSISISENAKGTGSAVVSRNGSVVAALRILLHTADAAGVDYIPAAALINFDEAYSNGLDNDDFRKFLNGTENVSVINGSNLLEVERRKMVTEADTIFLSITRTQAKPYKLQLQASDIFAPGLQAFLADRFTNSQSMFTLDGSSNYPFIVTGDAASYAANRFYIIFKQSVVLPVSFVYIDAKRNADKTVAVSWKVESESSIKNYAIENSADGINFQSIGIVPALNNNAVTTYNFNHTTASAKVNFYRIRSIDLVTASKLSATAKVNALSDGNNVQIIPNPVKGGVINIQSSLEAGKYAVRLIDAKGAIVFSSSIIQTSANASNTLKVGNVSAGIYQLVMIDANNKTISTKVIIE